jgi:hypothetical protein
VSMLGCVSDVLEPGTQCAKTCSQMNALLLEPDVLCKCCAACDGDLEKSVLPTVHATCLLSTILQCSTQVKPRKAETPFNMMLKRSIWVESPLDECLWCCWPEELPPQSHAQFTPPHDNISAHSMQTSISEDLIQQRLGLTLFFRPWFLLAIRYSYNITCAIQNQR